MLLIPLRFAAWVGLSSLVVFAFVLAFAPISLADGSASSAEEERDEEMDRAREAAEDRADSSNAGPPLTLEWKREILTIAGEHLPGRTLEVLYIEAFCRPGSTDADWVQHTVIPHRTELRSRSEDGTQLELRSTLEDGVIVEHRLTSTHDEVDIRVRAHNPTARTSEAHWAQPCVRVGAFTGLGDPQKSASYEYLARSFVFIDGEARTLPTKPWAKEARYTPGQVWVAPGVPRSDVNPRPVNPRTPSCGLIGCRSADEKSLFAVAFEPYQELFQGVITCLHSDFRIGGLAPGETREIRGKLYFLPNDLERLLARYHRDFPEHRALHAKSDSREAGATSEPEPSTSAAPNDRGNRTRPRGK